MSQRLLKVVMVGCLALTVGFTTSCKKDEPDDVLPVTPKPNLNSALKEVAPFPVGVAVNYSLLMNDPAYANVVKNNFNSLTFEYQLKHGAVVRNDGTYNWAPVDQMVDFATQHKMRFFGHTLAWHQNNNADYLRSLTRGTASTSTTNLLANGSFEAGSGDDFTHWSKLNNPGGTAITAETADVTQGARAFKATAIAAGNPWSVQLASDLFNTTVGNAYKVTFDIKAAAAGGNMRLSTGPTASYSQDFTIPNAWTINEWTFVAKDDRTRILFDVGRVANTYIIDNVKVVDASGTTPLPSEQIAAAMDNALKSWITTAVTRYRGKVDAWDVVNEPILDNSGSLRTNPTPGTPTTGDIFYWAEFLGKEYIAKAFRYAHEADPNALLFLNDYNQESDATKLNAFVALAEELKAAGVPIHGVGLQMHISINTPNSGIDMAISKLAATGLKVHISELDVRTNPGNQASYTFTPNIATLQAEKVKYVIQSYRRNVPAAQQYGITFWNVTDKDSWIVQTPGRIDNPTLFTETYEKKQAYFAALQALQAR